jgi:hypothetical protein
MTGAVDQKTYWGLGELVMWIRTRNHERVAALSDMSEEEAMRVAMFAFKARLDRTPLPSLLVANSDADREGAAPQGDGKSSHIDGPISMPPDQAFDDLHRKMHSSRVQMTAIRCDGSSDQQIPVPPAEQNDLIFRLSPRHPVAAVGLWSRSRNILVWRSPQFLRANGMQVWPAPNTKTAAVSGAVLRHLREIMTPEAPLTKLEAQRRCLAEVPNAYPGAFKKAWVELETSYKRGRGKHGARGHWRIGKPPNETSGQ